MSAAQRNCPICNAELAADSGSCPSCGAVTLRDVPSVDPLSTLREALSASYRIEGELGRGGMAIVYLAEDLKHRRKVAVKVMRPELTASLGRERFFREIEIAGSLSHPHILSLYDSGAVPGLFYYVMPHVEGESLRARLDREKQLPIQEALQIAREVAEALSYAHSRNVIHRDIKPDNILLSGGHAVVSDFGVARAISAAGGDTLTGSGTSVGTPAYMSPEQAAGESDLDGRTDVYSLGCVLYEMLGGDPPFVGTSAQAVLARKLAGTVPDLRTVRETVPEGLEQVVIKSLARVPADRFATAAAFAEALGEAQLTGPVSGPAVRLRAGGRLRATRGRIAAAVAALVVLAAALVWGPRGSSPDPGRGVSRERVAVLPFAYLGDDEFAYLGDGMVSLLSTVLDGVGELRTLDPSAVVGLVERTGTGAPGPEQMRAVAEQLGAGRYVAGNVVVEPGGRVSISARAYDYLSPQAEPVRAAVEGSGPDQLFRLVNDLAVQLMGAFGIEESPPRLESISTTSPLALNEYLKGEIAFRGGDLDEAPAAFERAVAADSLFALAWYRLAYSKRLASARFEDAMEPLRRALQLGDRLSERDRRLAEAQEALIQADAGRADRLYRALIIDYPNDVEALMGRAETHLHFGPLFGFPMDSVAAGFQRVLFFEPRNAEALLHLPWAAAIVGDMATVDSSTRVLRDVPSQSKYIQAYDVTLAVLQDDEQAWNRALGEMQATDFFTKLYAWNMVALLGKLGEAVSLSARLLSAADNPDEMRAAGHIMGAHLEHAMGRWEAARHHLAALEAITPARALEEEALLALVPLARPPRPALVDLRARIEAWDATAVPDGGSANPILAPHEGVHPLLRLYLLGSLSMALDDRASAVAQAEALEGIDSAGVVLPIQLALAHNLRGQIAAADGQPEEALRHFDAGGLQRHWERAYGSMLFSQTYERFLRAEALERLGRHEEALLWYESLWMVIPFDMPYLAPSHYRRAAIYEQMGEPGEAIEQYTRFTELWSDPDPAGSRLVEDVRQRIDDLRGR